MSENDTSEKLINWGESIFQVTETGDLKVVIQSDQLGLCDMDTWDEAVLDGPLANIRRANDALADYGIDSQINTERLLEKVTAKSWSIFLRPLIELERYAKECNSVPLQSKLF